MTENANPIARDEDRHSHIGIRLQYRVNSHWERFEALGWNDVGFNFYYAQEIAEPVLALKRGLKQFPGTIVWTSLNTSDEAVLSTLVNTLLFDRAKHIVDNPQLQHRLMRLIRVPGMVPEKRKILASLGQDLSDASLSDMITRRRLERPKYHYGVRVASDVWGAVVKEAISISSVVMSMDKWSDALVKR